VRGIRGIRSEFVPRLSRFATLPSRSWSDEGHVGFLLAGPAQVSAEVRAQGATPTRRERRARADALETGVKGRGSEIAVRRNVSGMRRIRAER